MSRSSGDPNPPHPAPFSHVVLDAIEEILTRKEQQLLTLDPFAGLGRIHYVCGAGIALELEYDWVKQSEGMAVVADALDLPFPDASIPQAVTSCCFGNRMADHHNAQDDSLRHTYHHYMVNAAGHGLRPETACTYQWGKPYREFHIKAWREMSRVVTDTFVLHIGDHIRNGSKMQVVDFHLNVLNALGWWDEKAIFVETPHLRHGENWDLRVDDEQVIRFRRHNL